MKTVIPLYRILISFFKSSFLDTVPFHKDIEIVNIGVCGDTLYKPVPLQRVG